MSDVVEVVEGNTTFHIYGLRSRGWELMALSGQLRESLAERGAACARALVDFEGPIAHQFHDENTSLLGSLVVLCRGVEEAGSICLNFPGPSHASYPALPRIETPQGSAFAADPAALRGFVASATAADGLAQRAGHAVDLHGVTATATVRTFVTPSGGGAPEERISPSVPIDPATLVTLPNVANITAMVLARSGATTEMAELTARAVEQADGPTGFLGWIQLLGFIVQLNRSQGVPPAAYAEHLQNYWFARGLERAGIDLADWDPALGADANLHNIEAVYTYYGNLFLENPHLEWAGMANMIGPSFAGGFLDLALFRRLSDAMTEIPMVPDEVRDLPGFPTPPVEGLGDLSAEEFLFYESTMLQMQKDIFLDASVMHEAYLAGGMPAIRELGRAGFLDPSGVQAWSLIDRGSRSGNREHVSQGNTMLLDREQNQTIRRSYEDMYSRHPSGPTMTYLFTVAGEPSIPGARSFADVYPLDAKIPVVPTDIGFTTPSSLGTPRSVLGREIPSFSVGIPSFSAEIPETDLIVESPLPDGNVAHQDDRWRLILNDTLPAFQDLLADDPRLAREIIATPVSERIDDYRLASRFDDIVHDLATDWDIYLETDD